MELPEGTAGPEEGSWDSCYRTSKRALWLEKSGKNSQVLLECEKEHRENVHRERGRGRDSRQSTRGKAQNPEGPMACAEDKGVTAGTEQRAIPAGDG